MRKAVNKARQHCVLHRNWFHRKLGGRQSSYIARFVSRPDHLTCESVSETMWKCVVSVLCLVLLGPGRLQSATVVPNSIIAGTPEAKTLKVDSDPWMSIVECFKSDTPGGCLQRRAFKALLSWADNDEANEIPSEERKTESAEDSSSDGSLKVQESLPAGTPPAVGRIIDRLGDLIASSLAQFYPEPSDNESQNGNDSEERSSAENGIEQGMFSIILYDIFYVIKKNKKSMRKIF